MHFSCFFRQAFRHVSFPRVLSLFKMRTQCSDTTLSFVRAVLGTDEILDCWLHAPDIRDLSKNLISRCWMPRETRTCLQRGFLQKSLSVFKAASWGSKCPSLHAISRTLRKMVTTREIRENRQIYNGNWAEWSVTCLKSYPWLKSDERAAQVRFEITCLISDQKCTTRSSITTLLQPFWNRRIHSVPIFYWPSNPFIEKWKEKGFYVSNRYNDRAKMVRKRVWFTSEGQLDYGDHQWFQNGYNKEMKRNDIDDGARKWKSRLTHSRACGNMGTGSSTHSFPRAFPSSMDVPVILLTTPTNASSFENADIFKHFALHPHYKDHTQRMVY